MEYWISRRGAVQIVSLSGEVDHKAAGTLFDVLIGCVGNPQDKLIVDLSGVTWMTRAGVRGIIVAAKLSQAAGGQMRIAGAKPAVRAFLSGLGFDPLLKLDLTFEDSLVIMAPEKSPPMIFDVLGDLLTDAGAEISTYPSRVGQNISAKPRRVASGFDF